MNDLSDSIVLINKPEIINVVRRALSKIDTRLVDHGERVGYIASKILEECPDKSDFDFSKLYVLCALHDIGAYKTNEIDDMVKFETDAVYEHSLFGYLFLKNTTHLSESAEAILYHHTDFTSPEMHESRYAKYAQMIHLADRADILICGGVKDLSPIKHLSGGKFNPVYVEALLRAEERHNISKSIITGLYKNEMQDIPITIDIGGSEILDYLKLLVYAIDFRSPYTVTHTADTTLISLAIGRLLNLSKHDIEALYIGSFLHDIGKIAISQSILEKPGRLTPEEYAIVKEHIPEGENILRGVLSDEICDIALRHHEKLDGSGYSRGIKGELLTLPQRIVAVADITSALSQRRSYKEPFPKEKVLGILNDMVLYGQICPLVTNTVRENYELILNGTEKSHDPVKTLYNSIMSEYRAKIDEHTSRAGEHTHAVPRKI